MSTADTTETNPILATGLAVVGLLGVAVALLPSSVFSTVTDTPAQASAAMGSEVEPAAHAKPTADDGTESATTARQQPDQPVFKPVELQSISADDPLPGTTLSAQEPALTATPSQTLQQAPALAPDDAVGDMGEGAQAAKGAALPQRQADAAASVASDGMAPETLSPKAVSPDAAAVAPAPSLGQVQQPMQARAPQPPMSGWAPWQQPQYQAPPPPQPYQAPRPMVPAYPPQYYGHPQWGQPAR